MTTDQVTPCATCYSLQPCIDDGEAYICADVAACQARTAADVEARLREALDTAQSHIGALLSEGCDDATRQAARAWLRREAK